MAAKTEIKMPIVCLSTQDYNDLWTRKQRFMANFARLGHRVLYVEAQWHLITYLRNLRTSWRRCYKFLRKPCEVAPNLLVATPPLLLPFFQMCSLIASVNNLIIGLWLRRMTCKSGIEKPLIYTYVPYSHLAIKLIGADRVLYEKVDDFAAATGLVRKSTVDRLEKRLLRMAQLVIVTATRLKTMMQGRHNNVHVIPNACEVGHFNKAASASKPAEAIASLPQPRIGFVGAIAYWIDLELVEFIARSRPNWQLIFIGPLRVDTRRLQSYANVHFTNRVPYQSLPSYMTGIDVFINPYKRDGVAESCSPLKLFEYLAAGKPVVSVPMPEVMRFAPQVRIAHNYDEFVCRIEELLLLTEKEKRELSVELMSLVKDDDWENRFDRTRKIVAETFAV